jgi:A/G-specific adenine glycosylase
MLQQTRVEAVIPYYIRFMEHFPDLRSLACGDEEELMKCWEGLGYYSRARNLQKAAQKVCEEYEGVFPKCPEDIRKLPGIGPYTCGAIASISFGLPVAAVDGNVLRVFTRLTECDRDIMDMAFRKEAAATLESIYPEEKSAVFTQSLMELGALVCVPNGAPKCSECPLKDFCGAYKSETQLLYPVKKKKAERRIEKKTVLLLCYEDEIALCKRPKEGLLADMWEFPNLEGWLNLQEIIAWLAQQGIAAGEIMQQNERKHIFSHVEWHMRCYRVNCLEVDKDKNAMQWLERGRMEQEIALPTAFRKFL